MVTSAAGGAGESVEPGDRAPGILGCSVISLCRLDLYAEEAAPIPFDGNPAGLSHSGQ